VERLQHDVGGETSSLGTEPDEETEFRDVSLQISMRDFDEVDLNNDDGAIASTSAEIHPTPVTPAQP